MNGLKIKSFVKEKNTQLMKIIKRSETAPILSSRVELTPLTGVQVIQDYKYVWEIWPNSSFAMCWSGRRIDDFPIYFPSTLMVGGRAGSEVMSVGELVCTLTSCSIWESRPCTPPGQNRRDVHDVMSVGRVRELAHHLTSCNIWESRPCTSPGKNSRAGCGEKSVDKLYSRAWEQENWPHSLPSAPLGELARAVVVTMRECRQADQGSCHPGLEPGLQSSSPQYPPYLWTAQHE